MSKIITTKIYKSMLLDKGIEVKPIEDYNGRKEEILHKCICGKEWSVTPGRVLLGNKCGCGYKKKNKRQTYFQVDYDKELISKKIIPVPVEKFITLSTKINHKCKCGKIWKITPTNILKGQSCGCKFIGNKEHIQELKLNNISVQLVGKYTNKHSLTKYKCSCGKIFDTKPSQVLKGYKCGCMRNYSLRGLDFYKNKKTVLYYLKVNNVFKIGITLFRKNIEHSIFKSRFNNDIKKGVIIHINDCVVYDDGREAYKIEQSILSEYQEFKYNGCNILLSGNSELFSKDIRPLENIEPYN